MKSTVPVKSAVPVSGTSSVPLLKWQSFTHPAPAPCQQAAQTGVVLQMSDPEMREMGAAQAIPASGDDTNNMVTATVQQDAINTAVLQSATAGRGVQAASVLQSGDLLGQEAALEHVVPLGHVVPQFVDHSNAFGCSITSWLGIPEQGNGTSTPQGNKAEGPLPPSS